ncbi:hypothetical protein Tco_1513830, partial [Tanacetum coccineum]
MLYDLTRSQVPSYSDHLNHVKDLFHDQHGGFTATLLDSLFSKGLRTAKSIYPKCQSIVSAIRSYGVAGGSLQLMREDLAESSPPLLDVDEVDLDMGDQNIMQCKRKICDGHYTIRVGVLSSFRITPYNDVTLEDLKTKHPSSMP